MKIRYYVKKSFSGIEEIDIEDMLFNEYSKQYYDAKTWRYFNNNLIFKTQKIALEFCLDRLKENRDRARIKAALQADKIAAFLIKYEGKI